EDTFTVDAVGRVVGGASQRYGTVTARNFDTGGRLTSESVSLPSPAESYTVSYAYDGKDRLSGTTYPDGSVVSRGYTPRSELSTISLGSQAIAQFTYDSGGRLTSTALGNGLQESKSYRNDNLLSSMTTTAVGTITHSYDGDKRKLTEAGTAVSGDQTFAYDNGGRLTSWQRGFPGLRNQSWVLSPVGDWVSTSRDGETE